MQVFGNTVDDQTRCVHYRTAADIVAIKFVCCDRYYPCFTCHADDAQHPAERWPADRFDEPAILCGVCRAELSIHEYRTVTACPRCGSAFNDGCRLHAHLYFEVEPLVRPASVQVNGE